MGFAEQSKADAAYLEKERLNKALSEVGTKKALKAAAIARGDASGFQSVVNWFQSVINWWNSAAKVIGIVLLLIACIATFVWGLGSLSSVAVTIPGWAVLLFVLWLIFK